MASSEEPAPRVTPGMTRKLAAILSADVVEYSRLMGEDEEATVRTVTVYRDVIAALVQQYRGRVVDSPGDNLLAEFASVLDAVQCAVAIQRDLNARNTALPPDSDHRATGGRHDELSHVGSVLRPRLTRHLCRARGDRPEDHEGTGGAVDNGRGNAHGTTIHEQSGSLGVFHAWGRALSALHTKG